MGSKLPVDLSHRHCLSQTKDKYQSIGQTQTRPINKQKLRLSLRTHKISQEINIVSKQPENLETKESRSTQDYAISQKSKLTTQTVDEKNKLQKIKQKIIGYDSKFISPFRVNIRALYLDHTATNRPYVQVQHKIEHIKKYIANPHTQYSYYGKFSDELMNYSQVSILESFGTTKDKYFAIPAGSGSTGAIEKAIKIITEVVKIENLKVSIFTTPYEHHSNLLPWIEFFDKVCQLPATECGSLKQDEIEAFILNDSCQLAIVSISGASNVTSQITNLQNLNHIIRNVRANKFVIFCVDCAAYTPHTQLNLSELSQIDFVYLSPHKNLGGSQSCGVLIAKHEIYNILKKPTFPSGGTVKFVSGYKQSDIVYQSDGFKTEIAGTPPFIGFYRAALSYELLRKIGYEYIHERERHNIRLFLQLLKGTEKILLQKNKSIKIYGDKNFENRANVITFNIFNNQQPVYHHYASLLFTDIFGIQLRSGCFCAGPYGKQLLNLTESQLNKVEKEVRVQITRNKPGFLRLDLTFYLQDYQIRYLVKAMELIALYNQNMLGLYNILYNGEVKKHHYLYEPRFHQMFGLNNQLFEEVQKFEDDLKSMDTLKTRQASFTTQLQNAEIILKDPIKYLNSIRNQSKLYD